MDLTQDTTTLLRDTEARYEAYKARGLSLDMTRGKPASKQLDLSNAMLSLPGDSFKSADGTDTRNYGGLEGLPETRQLFADMLGVSASQVLIGGNASLQLMFDAVTRAMLFGVPGGTAPWIKSGPVKFLCPVPGYDRHFAICEHFGIEMVSVAMDENGPVMDEVERLVANDASIRGMWCVPKYANPDGVVYSADTVKRLAAMNTAASDFRLFWDNAYAVHHLGEGPAPLEEILAACAAAGHPDRALVFASTSKITLAGAGISAVASSAANVADIVKQTGIQTIGPDKVNQLRHMQFLKNHEGLLAHMDKHAALLAPKFAAIQTIFARELGDLTVEGQPVATWSDPKGGYFVSLDTRNGLAKAVVAACAEAGVKLTKAGATFPYGKDPNDRNIRIAPSLPPLAEVETAMEIVATAVKLCTLRSLTR